MRSSMLAVALVLLLSACGFHLRGDLALPPEMQSTYIEYRGSDAGLLRTIARAVMLAGGGIARDRETASAILLLPKTAIKRRVLAKDIEGRPREYEIVVELGYSVVTPEGTVLVSRLDSARRGNVVLDPSQPLANAGEVARAVEGLREDAVWDMLRRIAAAEIPPQAVEADEAMIGKAGGASE